MEIGIVQRESQLPLRTIPAAAINGRGPLTMLRNSLTLLNGARAAVRLIQREKPHVILGTGGYVCVPVFMAARLLGIPSVVYLPDVVPGLAVRLLSRLATATAGSVSDAARYLGKNPRDFSADLVDLVSSQEPGKILQSTLVVVGYPVRPELFDLDRAACRAAFGLRDDLPVLVVYGGSRGARSINQAVAALLPDLLAFAQIIHICGREGDASMLEAAAARLPSELRERYQFYPYLEAGERSMSAALGAADVALCRSGASTLGELPAVGLPAVLVPYPYVHQDENADYLVRFGAARKVVDVGMLGDGPPNDGPLYTELRRILEATSEATSMRAEMAACSRSLARPSAAQQLADLVLALAARRRAA
ncbi:MAG: UDP-N-acetylglucosamine--N-acetylmuramyl-(pentapeptide) pyrophosphoryl-undecaprenol N-acetylglucosamine transferase [Roseiflexaceae bacterium]